MFRTQSENKSKAYFHFDCCDSGFGHACKGMFERPAVLQKEGQKPLPPTAHEISIYLSWSASPPLHLRVIEDAFDDGGHVVVAVLSEATTEDDASFRRGEGAIAVSQFLHLAMFYCFFDSRHIASFRR